MCEGYDWWYECQGCFGIIFDNNGRWPEKCPDCGCRSDQWKRIEADEAAPILFTKKTSVSDST